MAENEHANDEQHEVAWQWAGRIVVAAVLIGGGLFGAYMKWGNAPELQAQLEKKQHEVTRLGKILEELQAKIDRTGRDKDACKHELALVKQK